MRCCLRALSYFRDDWKRVTLFLLLVTLSIGIGVMQAWPMAVLVDIVLNPTPAHPSWPQRLFLFALPHRRMAQIVGVTLIGMGLKIAQDALGAVKLLIGRHVTYNGRFRLRHELYAKLQGLSPAYHRALPQGDAIYRVLNDSVGGDQIINVLLNSLISAVTLAAMVCIMLSRNVPLTFFALSAAPLLLISNSYFGKKIKRSSVAMKKVDTRLTTLVQRGMTSLNLIQACNREADDLGHFNSVADSSSRANYALDWYNAMSSFVTCTIYSLGGACIFGYGAFLVYRDQFAHPVAGGVTCGDLMVFMAYLGSIWEPLRILASTKSDLQTGIAGVERVFEVLDEEVGIEEPAEPFKPFPLRPRTISLRNLDFSYDGDRPILQGINGTIPSGEMVAFIGRSGAGKSTLLQLIPRFADVTAGSIQLDGIDIRRLSFADLRRHIAVVPQDSPLLCATVAQNIAYARPDAMRGEIQAAAVLAGAHDFIAELPGGYDTVVGEGGQSFSGGQRQRIAIARALLSDAPIILLDEPTSALDPENSARIMSLLRRVRHHRTVVLVTHDLGSVKECDQIFLLDNGQLVEHGTHQTLLMKDGLYTELIESEELTDDQLPNAA